MSTPIQATVGDIVAGRYPEDTTVTLTGQANSFTWKATKQDNTWATFLLISLDLYTAVDAMLFPAAYRDFGDGMGPLLPDYRPQNITVTGRVSHQGLQHRSAVIVTDVRRLSDGPCESLDTLRRHHLRAEAALREQEAASS